MLNTAGMGIGMWIFWIVVIFIVVFVVRLMMDETSGTTSKNPVEILKQCYARGEINKDEFESMKKELEKQQTSNPKR